MKTICVILRKREDGKTATEWGVREKGSGRIRACQRQRHEATVSKKVS